MQRGAHTAVTQPIAASRIGSGCFATGVGRALPRALLALLACGLAAPAWADDPPGKDAYGRVCARCHGDDPADGADGPALIPMYRTLQQVLGIVRSGTGKMHPLPESKISDAEVAAIVAYLQTLGK